MKNQFLDNSLLQSQRELNKDSSMDENTWMRQVSSRKSQQISSEELSQILKKHSLLNKNTCYNNNEGGIKNRNSMIINRKNIKTLLITENNNESNQSLNSDKINNKKYESSDSLSESSSHKEEEKEIQNDNQNIDNKIKEEELNFNISSIENNKNNIDINIENDNNYSESKDKNINIKDEDLKDNSQNVNMNDQNNINNQNVIENDINLNNNSNDNKNNENNLKNNNNLKDELYINNIQPSEIKEEISEENKEELKIKNFQLKNIKNQEQKKDQFNHIILSTEDKFKMLCQSYLKIPNYFIFKNDKNEEKNEETNIKNIDLNNGKNIIIEPMINTKNPELELLSYNPGNKPNNPFSVNGAFMRNKNYLTERMYNNIHNEKTNENNEENNNETIEKNNKGSLKNRNYIGRNTFKYLEEISKSPSENNIFIEKYGNSPFNSIEYNSISPDKIREDFYNEKNNNINNQIKKFNTINSEKNLFKRKYKNDNRSNSNNVIMPSNLDNTNYGSTIVVSEDNSNVRKIINISRNKYLQSKIPSLKETLKTINRNFFPNNIESIENEINNETSVIKGVEKSLTQRIINISTQNRLFDNINKEIKNQNLKSNNTNKSNVSSSLYNSRNQKRNNIYKLSYYKNNGFRTNIDLMNKINLSPNPNEYNKKEKEMITNYNNRHQKISTNSISPTKLLSSNKNTSKEKFNSTLKNKFKKNNPNLLNKENNINNNKNKKEILFYKFADYKLKNQLFPPNSLNSKNLQFFK